LNILRNESILSTITTASLLNSLRKSGKGIKRRKDLNLVVVSPTRTAHSVPCVVIGCASELIETCCAHLATFLGSRVQICSTHHGKLKDIIHC